mmetsp:Transcript_7032/g.25012  ORF Transcript_7032/g.25012 Transcript_7032/m.25012 type:complete len:577 (-) Transcript_7032:220-1950(-)
MVEAIPRPSFGEAAPGAGVVGGAGGVSSTRAIKAAQRGSELPCPSDLVFEAAKAVKGPPPVHIPLMRALADFAAPSAASPAWGAASQKRAIVVGAGMSGLAAARELRHRGFRVTVLEGRERLGGRAFTDTTVGMPVDLGACWMHGTDGNPVAAIVRRMRLATFCTSGEESVLFDHDLQSYALFDEDGTRVPTEVVEGAMAGFERLLERSSAVREALGDGEDRDMAATLTLALREAHEAGEVDLHGQAGRVLCWFIARVEGWFAAPMEDVSLVHNDNEVLLTGGHHMLVGGYGPVVRALADGLDVRFGADVVHVAHRARAGVEVTLRDGTVHKAEAVIVTAPLGVLKSDRITFEPALPAWKRAAIESLGFGRENKVVLRFKERLWPNVDFIGSTRNTAAECSYFLNLSRATGEPVLAYMPAGALAADMERKTDEEVVAATMTVLRGMLQGVDVPEPESFVITRWGSDPFSLGAYTYDRPGGAGDDDYAALARNCGRIYFAGEHTSEAYPAMVHGAFIEGTRAALEVAADSVGAAALRPRAGDKDGVKGSRKLRPGFARDEVSKTRWGSKTAQFRSML